MQRLQSWPFGFAGAVTFAVLYTACALAVALSPDDAIAFFNAWFHGLDLTLLKRPDGRASTLGQFCYGLFGAAAVSFAATTSIAGFYNLFVRVFRRS
jgi:hypothetical protein